MVILLIITTYSYQHYYYYLLIIVYNNNNHYYRLLLSLCVVIIIAVNFYLKFCYSCWYLRRKYNIYDWLWGREFVVRISSGFVWTRRFLFYSSGNMHIGRFRHITQCGFTEVTEEFAIVFLFSWFTTLKKQEFEG